MKTSEILREAGLRNTSSRRIIIELLLNADTALSEVDLEKILASECDRTTIYRTLNTLLENKLVHRLVDMDGVSRYVLNNQQQAVVSDHVHFKCNACGTISCLPENPSHEIRLPEGYHMLDTNFLVIGVCNDCNSSDK
ncbi:MAG: Fur family transcriptional regulator [Cyclobacteriaceae bacterium]